MYRVIAKRASSFFTTLFNRPLRCNSGFLAVSYTHLDVYKRQTYDLSGKTIVPFCTSGGSGLSNTVNTITELEPDATVLAGLHIGSSSASEPGDAVSEWLNELGLVP